MTKKEIFDYVKSMRDGMGASDARRDAGLKIPSDVKCIFDIRYSASDEFFKIHLNTLFVSSSAEGNLCSGASL